jgi:hypothetical protein
LHPVGFLNAPETRFFVRDISGFPANTLISALRAFAASGGLANFYPSNFADSGGFGP